MFELELSAYNISDHLLQKTTPGDCEAKKVGFGLIPAGLKNFTHRVFDWSPRRLETLEIIFSYEILAS